MPSFAAFNVTWSLLQGDLFYGIRQKVAVAEKHWHAAQSIPHLSNWQYQHFFTWNLAWGHCSSSLQSEFQPQFQRIAKSNHKSNNNNNNIFWLFDPFTLTCASVHFVTQCSYPLGGFFVRQPGHLSPDSSLTSLTSFSFTFFWYSMPAPKLYTMTVVAADQQTQPTTQEAMEIEGQNKCNQNVSETIIVGNFNAHVCLFVCKHCPVIPRQ